MKSIFSTIFLISILTIAQANLGSLDKEGRFIYPETNKPYTGNLDVLNNDWGKVEFSKDYLNGHLHGNEKVFYQSGRLKSLGHFNKGVLTGTVELYYEDGSIQARVNFNNGIKQGRAISYYPDGNKQLEQLFIDGKLDGLHRTWYENGNVMKSIPYSKGMVHGTLETYYESGGVFEEVEYNFGTPKYMRIYLEDGTVADEKGFFDRKLIERIVG